MVGAEGELELTTDFAPTDTFPVQAQRKSAHTNAADQMQVAGINVSWVVAGIALVGVFEFIVQCRAADGARPLELGPDGVT